MTDIKELKEHMEGMTTEMKSVSELFSWEMLSRKYVNP